MKADAVIVILARAGSKGVPGKNRAPVAGRPCVAWTIDHAKSAACEATIVVSTDDMAVAHAARSLGVGVVDRPEKFATDGARVDDAARHAVTEIERQHGPLADFTPIVILYGNVPVRPAGLIDRAVTLMRRTNCDSVQSYCRVGKSHPWWTARLDDESRVAPWEGEVLNHNVFRRQDLPPAYIPDGGVLAVTRRALFLEITGLPSGPHRFFGADRRGIVTKEGEVIDIDSPIDLIVADAVLRERGDAGFGRALGGAA